MKNINHAPILNQFPFFEENESGLYLVTPKNMFGNPDSYIMICAGPSYYLIQSTLFGIFTRHEFTSTKAAHKRIQAILDFANGKDI